MTREGDEDRGLGEDCFFLFVVEGVVEVVEGSAAACGSKLGDSPAAGVLFFFPIAHWW